MLKLYVNHFLQEKVWLTPLLKYPDYFTWTSLPEDADFLVLECPYEVMYDYSSQEYIQYGIETSDLKILRNSFETLKEISVRLNKKIIIFYYRDPATALNIPNAVIFRTSINKSTKEEFTFAMPAWIPQADEKYLLERSDNRMKSAKPSVTFRGQHAAMNLPFSTNVRLFGNKLLDIVGSNRKINVYCNPGYIARRNAIKSIINNRSEIHLDYASVSWEDQKENPQYFKQSYLESIINAEYVICSSGFGNYSYRFYETLAAGRIPIFINTNSELPFENIIDWKSVAIWCEENESNRVGKKTISFHSKFTPQSFLDLQKEIREIYLNYMCMDGFCRNIPKILDQLILMK